MERKALLWEGQSREQPPRSSIHMRKLKHHDLARVTQHVTPQNQDCNTGLNDFQTSVFPHRAFWRSGSCCSLCPDRLISFLPILMDICLWTRLVHTISSMNLFWQPLGTITCPFLMLSLQLLWLQALAQQSYHFVAYYRSLVSLC